MPYACQRTETFLFVSNLQTTHKTTGSHQPEVNFENFFVRFVFEVLCTSVQSAGVAPEVNLRNSAQPRKHASQTSTLALKPRAGINRSPKQGYQWPHEDDFMSSKFLF